jgi:hypothetical protein
MISEAYVRFFASRFGTDVQMIFRHLPCALRCIFIYRLGDNDGPHGERVVFKRLLAFAFDAVMIC